MRDEEEGVGSNETSCGILFIPRIFYFALDHSLRFICANSHFKYKCAYFDVSVSYVFINIHSSSITMIIVLLSCAMLIN